jgi:hypothetical protein
VKPLKEEENVNRGVLLFNLSAKKALKLLVVAIAKKQEELNFQALILLGLKTMYLTLKLEIKLI